MENKTKEQKKESKESKDLLPVFSKERNFALMQRMAQAISSSTLIPKEYQNNLPNCMIALEMAHRTGASPFMVMQNLDIIYGRPSWRSSFIISAVNSSGRFKPLRFEMTGKGETLSCYAFTTDKEGNELIGPTITMEMAKKEGWYDKNGSKWKTMPELMIRYRAAAFWGRLFAPEILMGMQTAEEVIDVDGQIINDSEDLKDLFDEKEQKQSKKEEKKEPEPEKRGENGGLFPEDNTPK